MTKSSYAAALLFAGWSAGAAAQAPANKVTADVAMQRYREWLNGFEQLGCPAAGHASDEEIVVCGHTHRPPERSPLPVAREPGEIVRHVGEPTMQDGGCTRLCEKPVTIDVINAARALPKIFRHIFGKDD